MDGLGESGELAPCLVVLRIHSSGNQSRYNKGMVSLVAARNGHPRKLALRVVLEAGPEGNGLRLEVDSISYLVETGVSGGVFPRIYISDPDHVPDP